MTSAPQSASVPAPPLRGDLDLDTNPPWFPTQDEIDEERGGVEKRAGERDGGEA